MPLDAETLSEVAHLARQIRAKLKAGGTLRLKTLADMLLIEAERPLAPKRLQPEKQAEP